MSTSVGDAGPHLFFDLLNPPFRDESFAFLGLFVANPATNFTKKTGGAFGRNAKTNTKIQSLLNKQKNALSAYSNAGRIVNWHPLKLCGHKKKTIDDPNAIVERGRFF